MVRELGADAVVDPQSPDLIERLRAVAPAGIDATLALAGGPQLERCLDLVRASGRVAYPNGVEPEPQSERDVRIIAYDAEVGRSRFEKLDRAVEEAGSGSRSPPPTRWNRRHAPMRWWSRGTSSDGLC